MARLQRTLSLGSVVLFGIAYMTPIIVLGTFGILAQSTGGMVPAAYLAALVAMFFTAMSYGRMASAFPVAGSAYTYVRKAISPKLGFIAGWAGRTCTRRSLRCLNGSGSWPLSVSPA